MRTDWPAPVDAIARYRSFAANRPSWDDDASWLDQGSPGSELLATCDIDAYAEWLLAPRLPGLRRTLSSRDELLGLVLRGGQGSVTFPPDNPWNLPGTTDLAAVIRQLWAPVADHAPAFLDRLTESAFAIAMVRLGDRDYLVYFTAAWVPPENVPDVATASIQELMDTSRLAVGEIWGSAPLPSSDTHAVSVLGGPLPDPLRALASVHGSMTIFDEEKVYIDLQEIEAYEEESELWPAGEYGMFARHLDGWYVLDLSTRETWGEATVVPHNPHASPLPAEREAVSSFLAVRLREMLDIEALA